MSTQRQRRGPSLQQAGRFLYRAAGTATAMALMELVAGYGGEPLWRVPFVTSIVLVTTLPHSEASRPYAVIVGHLISCLAGLASLHMLGPGNAATAVGVGLAALGMLAARAPHPPAGIDAFLIAANGLTLRWVVSPVMVGCVLLVAFSQGWRATETVIFKR
jgi:CBS-domain-containing membrane protein